MSKIKTAEEIFDDIWQPIPSDEIMKHKKDIIQAMNEFAEQFVNLAIQKHLEEIGFKLPTSFPPPTTNNDFFVR